MAKLWLAFFIVGGLVGRATAGALPTLGAAWTLAILAASGGAAILGGRRAALVLAAVTWGLFHAAPPLDRNLAEARLVQSATGSSTAGPVIVCAGASATCYETYGGQAEAALGRARVAPAPRLFARHHSSFQQFYAGTPAPAQLPAGALQALRVRFFRQLRRQPPLLRAWLAGLVLGDKRALPHGVLMGFRRLGLYHLLAVSGLHVSLASSLLAALVRAPLNLAYALRLIGPLAWRQVAAALRVAAATTSVLYLGVTGGTVAAQRSALVFVAWELAPVFLGVAPLPARLLAVAVAQTLLFPLGFVGEAALMSWAAYLFLADGAGRRHSPGGWWSPLTRQVKLTVLVTAAFGQLSLLAVPANLALVPAFGLLLASGLLLVLWPTVPLAPLVLDIHRTFLKIVSQIQLLVDRWPWLAPAPAALPLPLRLAAALAAAWFLLNACRNLSIRPYEAD